MTSKHCFFRMMKEDFRHKIWMLVLSVLGNMMAVPVTYLISVDTGSNVVTVRNLTSQIGRLGNFFVDTLMITGGIVAIAGALIVGLAGFRYVFHRNMVDTYHSIPVRRRTLFLVNWLNGFLIWFGPFLAALVVTVLLGLGKLSFLRNSLSSLVMSEAEKKTVSFWLTGGGLLKEALISLLALTTAFLLVYHLVLLAVMICGNMLNTLVTTAVLGTGALAIWALFHAFCGEYFYTFVQNAHTGYRQIMYASPLASSIVLLIRRGDYYELNGGSLFWLDVAINLGLALGMGLLAFYGYRRRPSELAEQGLRIKPVRFLIQIAVSLGAAMGGWIFFYMIGESAGLVWGIFGAVLAGGVAFGVLDIIFHMDFKSFFDHKILMGVMVAAGVCTGLLFYYDWLGYDSYLPEAEELAEIAVYNNLRSNGYGSYYDLDHTEHPLNSVHIRDIEAAYAFLESVTMPVRADMEEAGGYDDELILTKVTLHNGRTYYRKYTVTKKNDEPAYKLLSSPEYLDVNFRIGPEEGESYRTINLSRGYSYQEIQMNTEEGIRLFEAVCQGYNRDLEENPKAFICGDGRLLCSIKLFDEHYNFSRYLEVFEGMTHTREALRQQGFTEFAEPEDAENVEEIRLSLGYRYMEEEGGYDLVTMAREVYGVNPAEGPEEAADDTEAGYNPATADQKTMSSDEIVLHITDKEEIKELLELLSFEETRNYNGGAFRERQVYQITLIPVEKEESVVSEIPMSISYGTLPEKYILRFGTLASETAK